LSRVQRRFRLILRLKRSHTVLHGKALALVLDHKPYLPPHIQDGRTDGQTGIRSERTQTKNHDTLGLQGKRKSTLL
jgi:hypothetical protein